MAKKDEVEIPGEDYEVVPLTPLRRLEKRLEVIETTKTMNNMEKFIDKVLDMVELNQKIVEDIVKSNQALREDVGVLVGKMDALQSKVGTFVDMIQNAAESDVAGVAAENTAAVIKPLVEQLQTMNKHAQEANTTIVQSLENIDRRLKRTVPQASPAQPYSSARDILARRSTQPASHEQEGGQ